MGPESQDEWHQEPNDRVEAKVDLSLLHLKVSLRSRRVVCVCSQETVCPSSEALRMCSHRLAPCRVTCAVSNRPSRTSTIDLPELPRELVACHQSPSLTKERLVANREIETLSSFTRTLSGATSSLTSKRRATAVAASDWLLADVFGNSQGLRYLSAARLTPCHQRGLAPFALARNARVAVSGGRLKPRSCRATQLWRAEGRSHEILVDSKDTDPSFRMAIHGHDVVAIRKKMSSFKVGRALLS